MKHSISIRRSTARIFAVLVLATAGAAAFAAPASAHCAAHPHQLLDGATGFFLGSGVNIRTGPHLGCTSVGHGQAGQPAVYHCGTIGDRDPVSGRTTWTYVTRGSTNGWVNNAYLTGGGASVPCVG